MFIKLIKYDIHKKKIIKKMSIYLNVRNCEFRLWKANTRILRDTLPSLGLT